MKEPTAKLIPVTPGLLWLLGEALPDPQTYLADLPDNWASQSEWEQKLHFLGMEAQGMGTWRWQRGPWVVQLLPIAYGYHLQVYNEAQQEVVEDKNHKGRAGLEYLTSSVLPWWFNRIQQLVPTQESVDPKEFIEKVPQDYDLLDEVGRDLDRLGFTLDTAFRPHVWTLEIGPLKFYVYKVAQNASLHYQLEVHVRGKMIRLDSYEGGETRQIPGDVHHEIQTFRSTGLIEAVDPKAFVEQTPDIKEFLVQRFTHYADLIPTASDAEYGFVVSFFITCATDTLSQLIDRISKEAGIDPKDVAWSASPGHSDKPQRREVRVVYRKL